MSANLNIGVDVGGTNIKIAVVGTGGNIIYSGSVPTEAYKGYGHTINNIIKSIRNILNKNNLDTSRIGGIGFGFPGMVDPEKGMVKFLPNIPGWTDIEITDTIKNEFGLKAEIDNDVRCAALGEYNFGAGAAYNSMICLTIGTGIGSGIIIDGKLLRGANFCAGEIGHMILKDKDGPICGCGDTGCFETLGSGPAIVEMAEKYIMGGKSAKFRELAEGGEITPEIVARAAGFGDKVAGRIYQIAGYWIGIAVTNAINLLNPEIVIIGGGVANAGDLLIEPVKRTVRERALGTASEKLVITAAELGNNAGVIGASLLVCSEFSSYNNDVRF